MIFQEKPTALLWVKDATTDKFLSIGGVNRNETDPENAKAQLDKLLAIGGTSSATDGMTLIITKGAVDNG